MTADEIKTISDIFQSVCIGLAALVAGGWAVYRFFSLRTIEKATADLEAAKRALQQRAIADMRIDTKPVTHNGSHYIIVDALIRNNGDCDEVLDWSKSKLMASKVEASIDDKFSFSDWVAKGRRDARLAMIITTLEPGISQIESFIIKVPGPGIYYLTLSVSVSPSHRELTRQALNEAGVSSPVKSDEVWYASTFAHVSQDAP